MKSLYRFFHLDITRGIWQILKKTAIARFSGQTEQMRQKLLVKEFAKCSLNSQEKAFRISDMGFKMYSQFEEDGIILFILSVVGIKHYKLVEIGIGNGSENMSSNLILNHGFNAWLFDGSSRNVRLAKVFFKLNSFIGLKQPHLIKSWVTAENIDNLLKQSGISGEIDILSIDVDGNDLYIWESIETVRPRICIIETADFIPSSLSLSSPYDPLFNVWKKPKQIRDFRSASLLAMNNLAKKKGYRLIGSNKRGFNAIYLRNDIGVIEFPEVSIELVHDNKWTKDGQAKRWPKVKDCEWVTISYR